MQTWNAAIVITGKINAFSQCLRSTIRVPNNEDKVAKIPKVCEEEKILDSPECTIHSIYKIANDGCIQDVAEYFYFQINFSW